MNLVNLFEKKTLSYEENFMYCKDNTVINTFTTFDTSKTGYDFNIKTLLGYQNSDYSMGMTS